MPFSTEEYGACDQLVQIAFREDLGKAADEDNDLTSVALIPEDAEGRAVFVSRAKGVVAGLPAARLVFALLDPEVTFQELLADGSPVRAGSQLAVVSGPMRMILAGERVALNFLQRLSGIASLTAEHVELIADLPCKLLDTRKTTPGWRLLEKYAVRQGGGHNHRMGLYDGVLIKDNHLAALGRTPDVVARAVALARAEHGHKVPLEIEVDTLEQLDVALAAAPDIVLLDNMPPGVLREAVARRNAVAPCVLLEASGGVSLATLRAVAEAGVDRVSLGALTHSARALDIGLDYVFEETA